MIEWYNYPINKSTRDVSPSGYMIKPDWRLDMDILARKKRKKTGGRVAVFNIAEHECQYCHNKFSKHGAYNGYEPKFCSRECFGKSLVRESVCLQCGDNYHTSKKHGQRNKMFCSMKCAGDYKKGRPFSDEHRASISRVQQGKPIPWLHTIEVVEKIRKALRGKPQPWNRGVNHPNWKGGLSNSDREKDMGRVDYKEWRRLVYERDDFTCQKCFNRGGRLHAHHIKSYMDFPELRYVVDNGLTLCISCHHKLHWDKA